MVKGISKRVIVVNSTDKKLFEQAIFILSDGASAKQGVTDEMLLKEAQRIASGSSRGVKRKNNWFAVVYLGAGMMITAAAWAVWSALQL